MELPPPRPLPDVRLPQRDHRERWLRGCGVCGAEAKEPGPVEHSAEPDHDEPNVEAVEEWLRALCSVEAGDVTRHGTQLGCERAERDAGRGCAGDRGAILVRVVV